MLKHEVEVMVNMPLTYCLKCVANPAEFLGKSKYTYTAKELGEGKYEIVFRWVKWGMEKFYKVILEVRRYDNTIVYVSAPESPYEFYMKFELEETEDEKTRVRVEARMKAGFMADLLGKKDYRGFVEELVEKGILGITRQFAQALEVEEGAVIEGISCTGCILYDPSRKYCFALRKGVKDTERPICGGKFYISREKLLEALS